MVVPYKYNYPEKDNIDPTAHYDPDSHRVYVTFYEAKKVEERSEHDMPEHMPPPYSLFLEKNHTGHVVTVVGFSVNFPRELKNENGEFFEGTISILSLFRAAFRQCPPHIRQRDMEHKLAIERLIARHGLTVDIS